MMIVQADAQDEQDRAGAAEAARQAAAGAVDEGCGGGAGIRSPQKVFPDLHLNSHSFDSAGLAHA